MTDTDEAVERAAAELLAYLEVEHWCDACEAKQERDEGSWCPLTDRVIALRAALAAADGGEVERLRAALQQIDDGTYDPGAVIARPDREQR